MRIKFGVIIGVFAFIMLSFALFYVERKAQSLRSELAEINRQIVEDKNTIHSLESEWAYLTRPQRLRDISSEHTDLTSIEAIQIIDIEDIDFKTVMVSDLR